jgi:hypothetical protein
VIRNVPETPAVSVFCVEKPAFGVTGIPLFPDPVHPAGTAENEFAAAGVTLPLAAEKAPVP